MNYRETLTLALFGTMLWREARGEPDEGIIAVGFTVIERAFVRPNWWSEPYHDVISVITHAMQYTSMGYRKDPQLFSYPSPDDQWFPKCMMIAEDILAESIQNPVPTASHYFNPRSVAAPSWTFAPTSKFINSIGNHDFWFVLV